MLPVKDNSALVRDEHSQAVLNKDNNSLRNYKIFRDRVLKERENIEELTCKYNEVIDELREIRELLRKVLEVNN